MGAYHPYRYWRFVRALYPDGMLPEKPFFPSHLQYDKESSGKERCTANSQTCMQWEVLTEEAVTTSHQHKRFMDCLQPRNTLAVQQVQAGESHGSRRSTHLAISSCCMMCLLLRLSETAAELWLMNCCILKIHH